MLLRPPPASSGSVTGVQWILILPQTVTFSSNKHHTPYVYLHYSFPVDSLPFYFLLEILLPQDVFQRHEASHSLLSQQDVPVPPPVGTICFVFLIFRYTAIL